MIETLRKLGSTALRISYLYSKKAKQSINAGKISIGFQDKNSETPTEVHIPQVPIWQNMSLDTLCSLQPEVIEAIEREVKKNKFNVDQSMFDIRQAKPIEELNNEQKKLYYLLTNNHAQYQAILSNSLSRLENEWAIEAIQKNQQQNQEEEKPNWPQNALYCQNITKDPALISVLKKFLNCLCNHKLMENLVEPSFTKRLLSLKRDLIMQGAHLQGKQKTVESISILRPLSFQYEIWLGAKHNRHKNGRDLFIVKDTKIKNPNNSLLIRDKYPQIAVKYIMKKKKKPKDKLNYCIKCELLVEIEGAYKRKMKVEWIGPDGSGEPYSQRYMVIDYQSLCGGNPTIKSIFSF